MFEKEIADYEVQNINNAVDCCTNGILCLNIQNNLED